MRVLYIAGWMRSGTTLLSQLLDAAPRVFSAGEVTGIWDAAARGGRCSCGEPLALCPVWGHALKEVERSCGIGPDQHAALGAVTAATFRTKHFVRLRSQVARPPGDRDAATETVVSATRTLLRAALEAADADTLVDSSKLLPGMLLHLLSPETDLRVVHILRDPRAVAASELRTRDVRSGNAEFAPPGSGVATSLARWYYANISVAAGTRLLRVPRTGVRYEQLVATPGEVLREVVKAAELGDPIAPAQSTPHIAVGNPRRMQAGALSLHVDDRWTDELSGWNRLLAEVGALPTRLVTSGVGPWRSGEPRGHA